MTVQFASIANALAEVHDRAMYERDFGPHAPDQRDLYASFASAASWHDQFVAAKAWLEYVTSQSALAWDAALQRASELKPVFDVATSRDAGVAARYPNTATLLGARATVAARAVKTREAKKRANQTPAAPTPPSTTAPTDGAVH